MEIVVVGAALQADLFKQYGISPAMIDRWKKEYAAGKFFENTNNFNIASQKIRVSEFERLVGELLIENRMQRKQKRLAPSKKETIH